MTGDDSIQLTLVFDSDLLYVSLFLLFRFRTNGWAKIIIDRLIWDAGYNYPFFAYIGVEKGSLRIYKFKDRKEIK